MEIKGRKEKNDALKAIANVMDDILATRGEHLTTEQAVECINMIKAVDTKFNIDHGKRNYHKALQEGRLVLETTVDR